MKCARVVAALIVHEGRVLAQRRPEGKPRAGLWEFPGGKVEPGESDAEALVRECREELGAEIRVGPLVWATTHAYPDLEVTLLVYRAELEAGESPSAREEAQLEWIPLSELEARPFCEADRPLIALLAAGRI